MARVLTVAIALGGCKESPPSPGEVADRGWRAHELVIGAGEREKTCAAAGIAMQKVFTANRQAFVDAVAIDNDREALQQASEYMEAHQDRYRDLETRMEALAERCAVDATVQAAFKQMESP
jgi:hypothetical protein